MMASTSVAVALVILITRYDSAGDTFGEIRRSNVTIFLVIPAALATVAYVALAVGEACL